MKVMNGQAKQCLPVLGSISPHYVNLTIFMFFLMIIEYIWHAKNLMPYNYFSLYLS